MILKSKLFILDNQRDYVLKKLLLDDILFIFTQIFKNSQNFTVHQDVTKLMIYYFSLSDYDCFKIILTENNDSLDKFINLILNIISAYSDVEIEKFKYADLLKDEKELEKKKLKSPKTIKSEIREKMILFIKNMFNKFYVFNLVSEENKLEKNRNKMKFILDKLLRIFDKNMLEEFKCENEKNRKLYIELLYQFLIKLFTQNKIKLNEKDSNYENIKYFVNNFEEYFIEQTYDSVTEVRQICVSIINLILAAFEKSEYYEPFIKSFSKPENFEVISCLRYLDEELKSINSYFSDFKKIFGIIMNLYIDERLTFSILCENSLKLILEKFPIFCFDEMLKARNKNQISRIWHSTYKSIPNEYSGNKCSVDLRI